uniref:hypothetical protein n=2 Tax=Anoxybacillaceae TaxID=3120669 RepID=UPI000A700BF2
RHKKLALALVHASVGIPMFVFVLPAMDGQAAPRFYSPHDERLPSLRQTAIGKQGTPNARKQSSFVVDLQ